MDSKISTAALARRAASAHGGRPALRFKEDGAWRDLSYVELTSRVDTVADGLLGLGVRGGDRIGILADTSPEWTVIALAIARVGAVVVPIYPTNSPSECEWVLGDSGARIVFCGEPDQVAKLASVRGRLAALEQVIVVDGMAEGARPLRGLPLLPGDRAARLDAASAAVAPEDPCLIIYTSGTTGRRDASSPTVGSGWPAS